MNRTVSSRVRPGFKNIMCEVDGLLISNTVFDCSSMQECGISALIGMGVDS